MRTCFARCRKNRKTWSARSIDQLGQVAAGDLHPHDVAEEFADGAIRGVADAFEIGHQARQPRAEQARRFDRLGQRGAVVFLAVSTPVPRHAMFGYDGGRGDDFHLLQDLGRMRERPQFAAAIGTAVERVRNQLINGFGRKVGPQMLLMAGLPPALAAMAVVSRRLRRFDQIDPICSTRPLLACPQPVTSETRGRISNRLARFPACQPPTNESPRHRARRYPV